MTYATLGAPGVPHDISTWHPVHYPDFTSDESCLGKDHGELESCYVQDLCVYRTPPERDHTRVSMKVPTEDRSP